MSGEGTTRRGVLRSAGAVGTGVIWRRSRPGRVAVAQTTAEGALSIDRTVGDLVVLPRDPEATVTGTSALEPGSDIVVSVVSDQEPGFDESADTTVTDSGTWAATVDLGDAFVGQEFTTTVSDFNQEVRAPGVVGEVTGAIRFRDQRATASGTAVVVETARLGVGGFVALYEADLTGRIRGVSRYLTADRTYFDLVVTLDDPVVGETTLVAAAHVDTNGNEAFEFSPGEPLDARYGDGGDSVAAEATVTGVTPIPSTPTSQPEPASPALEPEPPTPGPESPTPGPESPTTEPPGSGADVVLAGAGGFLGVQMLRMVHSRLRPGDGTGGENGGDRDDGEDTAQSPVALFGYTPPKPVPGRPVLFDATPSFHPDADGRIVEYRWTIGDESRTGRRLVHVFGDDGSVNVELTVTDTRGATGVQARSVSVGEAEGTLELDGVHPGTAAEPSRNRREEYVRFGNTGTATLELGGWAIHDAAEAGDEVVAGGHTMHLPDGTMLAPGASMVVHTGEAPDRDDSTEQSTGVHLYWGQDEPVWDDESGVVVVTDDTDHPVLVTRYERVGGDRYTLERLDDGGIDGWFPSIDVSEDDKTPVPGVSVDAKLSRTALSNAGQFVAGALCLRGLEAFVGSWAQIAGFLLLALLTWGLSTAIGVVEPSVDPDGPLLLLVGSVLVTVAGGGILLVRRAGDALIGTVRS